MKRALYFCKIFSAFLFIFYALPSVTTAQGVRNGVITITDGDPLTGELVMRDDSGRTAHTFNAEHGQTIKWVVHPNSNVEEIVDITPKKDSTDNANIFSDLPKADGNSRNWKATIDTNADGLHEWYNIIWKDKGGKERIYDPLIQVKPKLPAQ